MVHRNQNQNSRQGEQLQIEMVFKSWITNQHLHNPSMPMNCILFKL